MNIIKMEQNEGHKSLFFTQYAWLAINVTIGVVKPPRLLLGILVIRKGNNTDLFQKHRAVHKNII